MVEIDWTAVIVAFIGGGGTLVTAIGIWASRRKDTPSREAEDRAVEAVSTPVAPGTGSHSVEAIRLAQQAMAQVSSLSEKLVRTESRLGEVEQELSVFRRSYRSLYWWSQRIISEWRVIREQPDPPALPEDIHHPSE